MQRRLRSSLLLVTCALVGGAARNASARSGALREFSLPRSGSVPEHLAFDADGSIWFTDAYHHTVCRLDTVTGAIAEVIPPGLPRTLTGLAIAPDGGIWYREGGAIFRLDPVTRKIEGYWQGGDGDDVWGTLVFRNNALWYQVQGGVVAFDLSSREPDFYRIIGTWRVVPRMLLAPSGYFWIAYGDQGILRVDSRDAGVHEIRGPSSEDISSLALDAEGSVWYVDKGRHMIGRLSPTDEKRTEFALDRHSEPTSLTVDAEGIVWYYDRDRERLGRIDPGTGAMREFEVPHAIADRLSIVTAIPRARLLMYSIRYGEAALFDAASERMESLELSHKGYVNDVHVDTARATVWIALTPSRIIEM